MSFTARQVRRPSSSSSALLNDLLGKDSGLVNGPAFEMSRLTDALKLKDKAIEEQMREITTLKSRVSVLQRDLQSKQSQVDAQQDKALAAIGGASASTKELSMVKADKKKLEAQVSDLLRANAKLKEQLERAGEKNPGLAAQLATMQSQVKTARAAADAAAEEARGVQNQLRAKDRELDRMSRLVEEAHAIATRNGELENRVRELSRQLDEAGEALRGAEALKRQREADIAKMDKELMAAREALGDANAAHALTAADLKAMSSRCTDLEAETSRLRDENARVGAVAARVAASEVRAGSKDEGTVPMMQHLEEVKYYQGEIGRLRDKMAGLEKQLAVSDELKNQYRAAAERAPNGSVAAPSESTHSRASSPGPGREPQPLADHPVNVPPESVDEAGKVKPPRRTRTSAKAQSDVRVSIIRTRSSANSEATHVA